MPGHSGDEATAGLDAISLCSTLCQCVHVCKYVCVCGLFVFYTMIQGLQRAPCQSRGYGRGNVMKVQKAHLLQPRGTIPWPSVHSDTPTHNHAKGKATGVPSFAFFMNYIIKAVR